MDENDSSSSEPAGSTPNETPDPNSGVTPTEPAKSEPPEKVIARPRSFWSELVLTTVQHANRSIAIFLIAILVAATVYSCRHELACWLANAESVKAGSFEVRLRAEIKANKLGPEFGKLVELNDQQLQLFLIVGRERGTNAAGPFNIAYTGEELTLPNLSKLKEIGLLDVAEPNGPNNLKWEVSKKGLELHKLMVAHIVSSIKDAAACQCDKNCQC